MPNPSTRHRWGEPSRPSELRTERLCVRCGVMKVTRKEARIPWVEYLDAEGVLIDAAGRTPPCEPDGLDVPY